jgi:hypothetical protein
MAMSTPKIRLTKRGVFQNGEILAPAIRLIARGRRLMDGGHIAQFRFHDMDGVNKSIYLEWEFTLSEKKVRTEVEARHRGLQVATGQEFGRCHLGRLGRY